MAREWKKKLRKPAWMTGRHGLFSGWRQSIRGKLLSSLLLISLVMVIIAGLSWWYSAWALRQQSFENLETTLAFQKQALTQYFTDQTKTLDSIADYVLQKLG